MKRLAQALFSIGFSCIFIAVAGIEGGDFTLGQGIAVGIIGCIGALATMQNTGWFYKN